VQAPFWNLKQTPEGASTSTFRVLIPSSRERLFELEAVPARSLWCSKTACARFNYFPELVNARTFGLIHLS
jgi:hypothetical protein